MFAPNALQRDAIAWAVGSDRYCFFEGEQGSGKTLAMALALVLLAISEPAVYGWMMPTIKQGESSARPALLTAAAEWGASASIKGGSVYLGSSEVMFFGDADVRSPDRLRSMNFAGGVVDEATIIDEPALEAFRSRVRIGSARLMLACNADNPYHFFRRNWMGDAEEYPEPLASKPGPRLWGTMADNPAISAETRADLESSLTGARYRRWLLGEWCAEVGLVWPELAEVEEEDDYLDVVGGCDWGSANPSAAVFLGRGVKSRAWRVIGEWRYEGGQATSVDVAAALAAACARYRCGRLHVDPSARDLILQLRMRGVAVAGGDNELLEGTYAVASAARTGALAVLRGRAPALMREVRTFSWDPRAAAKGIDLPDKSSAEGAHSADALRYASVPLFGKPSLRPRPNPWG